MFPVNQNFLSANAGLSNGNNPCFPAYLTAAPTSQTIYMPYGIVQIGQIAVVPAVGAWICIGLVSSSTGITATWEQMVTSSGDVLSVTGTANQILASPTTGNVVLSLIGPYTPATYTAHGVLIGEGTSSIVATAAGTAGQILTSGGASADPTWTTATFPSTVAAGSLLVGTASNVVGAIADVATGQALMSGGVGVVPAYTGSPSFSGSVTAGTTITATSGNITATSGNFVSSAAGNGIVLNSAATSGTTTATLNGRSGQITITTPTINAGSTFTMTISNTSITGSSTQVLYGLTGGTTGSAITIQSVTNSANQSAVVFQNASAVTNSTGSLVLTFLVLN